jgi:hypothetical protein
MDALAKATQAPVEAKTENEKKKVRGAQEMAFVAAELEK